jgi:hypothetical protein
VKSHSDLSLETIQETTAFLFKKMYCMNSSEEDEYYFFNNIIFDESLNASNKNGNVKVNKEEQPKACFHNWKKYVGFTESYFYCENCDEKTYDDKPPSSSTPWFLK